ncbi:hypothetical protein C8Q75DRAFT_807465 [Abortiporus biennis]|nr:hypothetical protein C8Q75DRAFT_807465 [Abortiporus biennis]
MYSIDTEFVSTHLSSYSLPTIKQILVGPTLSTEQLLQSVQSTLGSLSRSIYEGMSGQGRPSHPISFIPYDLPTSKSTRRIFAGIVADETASNTMVAPVVSLIACDSTSTHRKGALALSNHTSKFLDKRPDINGIYLLSTTKVGYQIGWADASGVVFSPLTKWECGGHKDLLAYVHSLYAPPSDHVFFDTSIGPIASSSRELAWNIHAGEKLFTKCEYIFHGSTFGRRTAVFGSPSEVEEDFVVIKDSFQDDSRIKSESDTLRQVHADGVVPGVVFLINSEKVCVKSDGNESQPLSVSTQVPESSRPNRRRTKHRLVMGSRGVSLSKARSVKDVLMATYDVLAIHRWLGKHRRIIHRDIGKNNILMYPQYRKDIMDSQVVEDPPQLIKTILRGGTTPVTVQDASCLIIDFDVATPLSEGDADSHLQKELTRRVGTPMYMARSVNTGYQGNLIQSSMFKPMPELTGEAKTLYIKSHNQETYDKYRDTNGTFHKGVFTKGAEGKKYPFVHRLDHDAESTFWLLLSTLLRAQPPDSKDDPLALEYLQYNWKILSESEPYQIFDPRNDLMDHTAEDLADMLHPDLRCLGPLLRTLIDHAVPEYAFLDPPPPEDHLHEAMSRILLQFIVDMKDDIPLDPDNLRPVDATTSDEAEESDSSTAYESDSDDSEDDDASTEETSEEETSESESEIVTPENSERNSSPEREPVCCTKRKLDTCDEQELRPKRLRVSLEM